MLGVESAGNGGELFLPFLLFGFGEPDCPAASDVFGLDDFRHPLDGGGEGIADVGDRAGSGSNQASFGQLDGR